MSIFDRNNRHKFYFGLNLALIILFLGSHFSAYLSAEYFWGFPFLAFLYPILLLLVFVFLIFWAIKQRVFFWYNLVAVLITYSTIVSLISFGNHSIENSKNSFKLMSWNVRLFDLYNWSNKVKTKAKIFGVIEEESPDIICFQEFYYDARKKTAGVFVTKDIIKDILDAPYEHEVYTDNVKNTYFYGAAIFSRFPLLNKGKITLEHSPSNVCLYADVLLPAKDTIRLYNVHLASVRLSYSDYRFLDNIHKPNDTVSFEQGSKNIFSRMKKAYLARSIQVQKIKDHMNASPYPVVICGDFNDPPFSYTYKKLSDDFQDAFLEAGLFLGATYANYLPLLRIDYILHDKNFETNYFKTVYKKHSDHYPVLSEIQLKNN